MINGITAKILEKISSGAIVSAALFETIIESGYGTSRSKLQKNFDRKINTNDNDQNQDIKRKRQNFYLILSKLKREGFIKKKEDKWFITSAGKGKLLKLFRKLPRRKYEKEADSTVKIIAFDIPERERGKRTWLRKNLEELGFKLLQKSVWMGKTKLPEEFLEDLREYKIFPYVDIFAITKSGSIKSIQ